MDHSQQQQPPPPQQQAQQQRQQQPHATAADGATPAMQSPSAQQMQMPMPMQMQMPLPSAAPMPSMNKYPFPAMQQPMQQPMGAPYQPPPYMPFQTQMQHPGIFFPHQMYQQQHPQQQQQQQMMQHYQTRPQQFQMQPAMAAMGQQQMNPGYPMSFAGTSAMGNMPVHIPQPALAQSAPSAASNAPNPALAPRQKKVLAIFSKDGQQVDLPTAKEPEPVAVASSSAPAAAPAPAAGSSTPSTSSQPAPPTQPSNASAEPFTGKRNQVEAGIPPAPQAPQDPRVVDNFKKLVAERANSKSPAQKPVAPSEILAKADSNPLSSAMAAMSIGTSTQVDPLADGKAKEAELAKKLEQARADAERKKLGNTREAVKDFDPNIFGGKGSSAFKPLAPVTPTNPSPVEPRSAASSAEPLSTVAVERKTLYKRQSGRIVYTPNDLRGIKTDMAKSGSLGLGYVTFLSSVRHIGGGSQDLQRQKSSDSNRAGFGTNMPPRNSSRSGRSGGGGPGADEGSEAWRKQHQQHQQHQQMSRQSQPQFKHDPNAWRPSKATDEHQVAMKKVKGILNKLTRENFDKLSAEMVNVAIPSFDSLVDMIALVFDKAKTESHFGAIYAELCTVLSTKSEIFVKQFLEVVEQEGQFYWTKTKDPSVTERLCGPHDTVEAAQKDANKTTGFRNILISRCQEEFEQEAPLTDIEKQIESVKEELSQYKNDETNPKATALSEKLSGLTLERGKMKRKVLGNIQFIGELYKQKLLAEKVIHTCITTLLKEDGSSIKNPVEEDIECLCKLLQTVGKRMDESSSETKAKMNEYFGQLKRLADNDLDSRLDSRHKFMVMDVIDLRKGGWKERREKLQVKTKEEIHMDAQREEMEKAKLAAKSASYGKGSYGPGSRSGSGKGPTFSAAFVSKSDSNPKSSSQDIRNGNFANVAPSSAPQKSADVSLKPGSKLSQPRPTPSPQPPSVVQSSKSDKDNGNEGNEGRKSATPPPASETPQSKGANPLDAKAESMIKSAFTDFLNLQDVKESRLTFSDLVEKGFSEEDIGKCAMRNLLDLVQTKKPEEIETLSILVGDLCSPRSEGDFRIRPKAVEDSLRPFFPKVPDVVIDAPKSEICIVILIAQFLCENVIEVGMLADLMEGLLKISEDVGYDVNPLVGKILQRAAQSKRRNVIEGIHASSDQLKEKFGPEVIPQVLEIDESMQASALSSSSASVSDEEMIDGASASVTPGIASLEGNGDNDEGDINGEDAPPMQQDDS